MHGTVETRNRPPLIVNTLQGDRNRHHFLLRTGPPPNFHRRLVALDNRGAYRFRLAKIGLKPEKRATATLKPKTNTGLAYGAQYVPLRERLVGVGPTSAERHHGHNDYREGGLRPSDWCIGLPRSSHRGLHGRRISENLGRPRIAPATQQP